MELQEITVEVERVEVEEERERMETKVEEKEATVYSKLKQTTEDIYAEATYPEQPSTGHKAALQVLGNVRLYRGVCFLLSLVCLVLLLVIIILCVQFPTQPAICVAGEVTEKEIEPQTRRSLTAEVCNLQRCRTLYPPQTQESCGHRCEEGWLHYESSCYFFSRIRLDWDQSREDCKTRGGDLAVITSQGEQTWLTTKGDLMYWIGLRKKDTTWIWVDHKPLRESYWGSIISRGQGDCGILLGRALFKESWSATICSHISPYICQKGH